MVAAGFHGTCMHSIVCAKLGKGLGVEVENDILLIKIIDHHQLSSLLQ